MENLVSALKVLLVVMSPALSAAENTLINGEVVPNGERPEVVMISMSGARCTATVVSDRVIITAAHCVSNGGKASFTYGQNSYTSTCKRSPIYPRRDHDLAICLVSEKIDGAKPASVDTTKLEVGETVEILGYGCTRPGGGGADGKLRRGEAKVTGFSGYDVVTENGAALCFGDSGGPMMKAKRLVAVNSKGNIRNTNYNLQLSSDESVSMMKEFAASNSVDICGVTKDCGATPPPKPANPCLEEKAVVTFFHARKADAESDLNLCQTSEN